MSEILNQEVEERKKRATMLFEQALESAGETEPPYFECVQLRTDILGPSHPDTLQALQGLRNSLRGQKKDSVDIYTRYFGYDGYDGICIVYLRE